MPTGFYTKRNSDESFEFIVPDDILLLYEEIKKDEPEAELKIRIFKASVKDVWAVTFQT